MGGNRRMRLTRHFVCRHDDGVSVTNYPTTESILDDAFRLGERRNFYEAASPAPASPSGIETERPTALGKPKYMRHIHFGTPRRAPSPRRATMGGTESPAGCPTKDVKVAPCALCGCEFLQTALRYATTQKAITERRVLWGCHQLSRAEVTPTNMYASRSVCVFCAQFFGIYHRDPRRSSPQRSAMLGTSNVVAAQRQKAQRIREYVRSMRAHYATVQASTVLPTAIEAPGILSPSAAADGSSAAYPRSPMVLLHSSRPCSTILLKGDRGPSDDESASSVDLMETLITTVDERTSRQDASSVIRGRLSTRENSMGSRASLKSYRAAPMPPVPQPSAAAAR